MTKGPEQTYYTPERGYGPVTDISAYARSIVASGNGPYDPQRFEGEYRNHYAKFMISCGWDVSHGWDNAAEQSFTEHMQRVKSPQIFVESELQRHLHYLAMLETNEMLEQINQKYLNNQGDIMYAFGLASDAFLRSGFLLRTKAGSLNNPILFMGFAGNATKYKYQESDYLNRLGVSYQPLWNDPHNRIAAEEVAEHALIKVRGSVHTWTRKIDSITNSSGETMFRDEAQQRIQQQIINALTSHGYRGTPQQTPYKPELPTRRPEPTPDYEALRRAHEDAGRAYAASQPSIYEGQTIHGTEYHRGPLGPGGKPFPQGPLGPDGRPFPRGPLGPGGQPFPRGPLGPGGKPFGGG